MLKRHGTPLGFGLLSIVATIACCECCNSCNFVLGERKNFTDTAYSWAFYTELSPEEEQDVADCKAERQRKAIQETKDYLEKLTYKAVLDNEAERKELLAALSLHLQNFPCVSQYFCEAFFVLKKVSSQKTSYQKISYQMKPHRQISHQKISRQETSSENTSNNSIYHYSPDQNLNALDAAAVMMYLKGVLRGEELDIEDNNTEIKVVPWTFRNFLKSPVECDVSDIKVVGTEIKLRGWEDIKPGRDVSATQLLHDARFMKTKNRKHMNEAKIKLADGRIIGFDKKNGVCTEKEAFDMARMAIEQLRKGEANVIGSGDYFHNIALTNNRNVYLILKPKDLSMK